MTERQLQSEIDQAAGRVRSGSVVSIRLGPDADVIDLSAAVSLRVCAGDQKEWDFTVMTVKCLDVLCSQAARRVEEQYYVIGGPLIVVKEISGESLVRSVNRFLELE